MESKKPLKEQLHDTNSRAGGAQQNEASEQIQQTELWLERGRKLAGPDPSPLWKMMLNAGERVLQSQRAEAPRETVYLMDTEDGLSVRVPESQLEAWSEAQKKHGSEPPTKDGERLRSALKRRFSE